MYAATAFDFSYISERLLRFIWKKFIEKPAGGFLSVYQLLI